MVNSKFFRRWAIPVFLAVSTALLCGLTARNGMAVPSLAALPGSGEQGAGVGEVVVLKAESQGSDLSPVWVSQGLVEQGRSLYEAGQYEAAIAVLQQAIDQYRGQGDGVAEAIALSNLSLVYQHLGQWEEATTAIHRAIDLLSSVPSQSAPSQSAPSQSALLAQTLNVQGRLQLSQGQAEAALATWEQVATLYEAVGDEDGVTRATINQTEAMQALGLYRRAVTTLAQLVNTVSEQPDSLTKAAALRSLGDALRVAGDLDRSLEVLQQSVAILEQLQRVTPGSAVDQAIAETQFSIGNALYTQGKITVRADNSSALQDNATAVLEAYQVAIALGSPLTQTQALLNQLSLHLDTENWQQAQSLVPGIATNLEQLPPTRAAIYARINFARSLATLRMSEAGTPVAVSLLDNAQWLVTALNQAKASQDVRAESFALGNLAGLYEQSRQWEEARQLTGQALVLSQQINAADMTYLWQWQLGRILKAQNQREEAIATYSEAVTTLKSLRNDLVGISQDVQFSFREGVEPVYRELVSLLLQPDVEPTPAELEQARKTIEDLQLAELDNFFREACLNAREVQIDEVDRRAAVFYPILLEDRMEVIFSLPAPLTPEPGTNSPESSALLKHYTVPLPKAQVELFVNQMYTLLVRSSRPTPDLPNWTQQLYGWLIEPFEAELESSQVRTLVFVLDGVLRKIPMAVLQKGDRYLIQDYAIAIAPGLQLLESQPIRSQELGVLLAGASEFPNFPGINALPGVVKEFEEIQAQVPNSQVLLNQEFTDANFQAAVNEIPFPIVHLATHGVFSSNLENTYILLWEERLNINELSSLLQTTDVSRRRPIELLVMSACQTAQGDNRAALGLAGIAVRSGARSTVATLWQVADVATPVFMDRFYEELGKPGVTKAEALRQAQLSLIESAEFFRPYYWSAFVLVGNWL